MLLHQQGKIEKLSASIRFTNHAQSYVKTNALSLFSYFFYFLCLVIVKPKKTDDL